MFSKILIANRGEIACRIIDTCEFCDVETVAVYSDADAGALHVRRAGEAVHIGPSPAGQSYLCGDKIIAAALNTGAQAIHPGYGFLSENPDFADAVAAAGLVFIGPSADAIRAMGLKDQAKALMEKAGVPVVPGYHRAKQDPDFLAAKAKMIGYPLMIKARAGGGGKGMRPVEKDTDFQDALASAKREAASAFGDDTVLIEKLIKNPRHIEVQIFGDAYGNVVHLFERDCSLQRRHQKVIEEAPAPGMTEPVRKAMTKAAVKAAKSIAYVGAGTVEFIVDGSGPLRPDGFWFMEMNTRLQVEHPVTEVITGVDLVEWQLAVAAGEALPLTQDELEIDGHAFEARVYAEDPTQNFRPSPGRLSGLELYDGVRVETGVETGDEISAFYDPMIAKLVTHSTERTRALSALTQALDNSLCAGPKNNLGFLSRLSRDADFAAGNFDTGLIGRQYDALTAVAPPSHRALLTAFTGLNEAETGFDPESGYTGWQAWQPAVFKNNVCLPDVKTQDLKVPEVSFELIPGPVTAGPGATVGPGTTVGAGAPHYAVTAYTIRKVFWRDRFDTDAYQEVGQNKTGGVLSHREGHTMWIKDGADCHAFALPDPLERAAVAGGGSDRLSAPMTGVVTMVSCAPGDRVKAGDPLFAVEAMKMEHVVKAPLDATVDRVLCRVGEAVTEGQEPVVFVRDETA